MAEDAGNGAAGFEGPGMRMVCPSCNATYGPDAMVCPDDGTGLLEIPDTPLLTGTTLDGRYAIGKVVGAGGMGIVYRAHQHAMARDVAIKVLHPHYAHDPRAVKRFFREAQAATRLIHPNIVTVYDFGRSGDGHLYMVMELLDGWTLGDLIFHRAPLAPATAVGLAVQICAALETAHKRRIVHRDLKPDNVQLLNRDGTVWAKVLDFGIARVMRDPDASLSMQLSTVDIAGTPAYMSPEQIMGKNPDPRSDLYSLGVIFYEMLTGERPFDDENSVTLCMKQLNEQPPALDRFVDTAGIPDVVQRLVFELLAKDVDRRPRDAGEVRERLAAVADGGSVTVPDLEAPAPFGDSLPTRPDAGAMMVMPTLDSLGEAGGLAPLAEGGSRLAQVLDGVRVTVPGRAERRPCTACGHEAAEAAEACPRCGHRARPARWGRAASEVAPGAWAGEEGAGAEAAAFGVMLVAHASDLAGGDVAAWLDERREAGWGVGIRDATVTVRVPGAGGASGTEAARALVERLERLRAAALRDNLALRMGVVTAADGEVAALDAARRLAVAAPHGSVAVPADLARDLGLRGRPITSVFLPSGRAMAACAVTARPGGDAPPLPELHGRNRELRRLGQLADEARRNGPALARVTGERGSGRTALLQGFAEGRAHLYLRVSPGAAAWPGHTAARLARRCLGLEDDAPEAAVRARLEPLALPVRERLAALLLDAPAEEVITARHLGEALADALARRAGEGAFCLLVDDAHHLDRASRDLLDALAASASGRPWLLVASTTPEGVAAGRVPFAGGQDVDLRPLGLRAAAALLQDRGVGARRRSDLMARAQGRPLDLVLLAGLRDGDAAPREGAAVSTLLPGFLRGLPAREAEQAWLRAAAGADEAPDDLTVRAARLYLDLGLSEDLRRWLVARLRARHGEVGRLEAAWSEDAAPMEARIGRCERLGLWSTAADEAELAAEADPDAAGAWLVESARLRARAGDVAGALERYRRAAAGGGRAAAPPSSLVRFAAVLLEVGEVDRAEAALQRAATALVRRPDVAVDGELAALLARAAVRRSALGEALLRLARVRDAVEALRPVDARQARALEALEQEVRAEVALAEGDGAAAATNLRQARDAFRDLGRPADALRCLVGLGRLALDEDDPARAGDVFRAAVRLAGTAGLGAELDRARVGLGEALVALGEVDEGTALLRRVLREAGGAADGGRSLAEAAIGLARAMIARGLTEDAVRYAERALTSSPRAGLEARALLALGEAHLAGERPRVAARSLREAAQAAAGAGEALLRARADRLLARAAAAGPDRPRTDYALGASGSAR